MTELATQETTAGLLIADRFRLLGMVGEGGMGTVFRAHDTELEELVALKVLRRSLLDQPNSLARFRQEVKLARRVAHPAVARIYDLGRDGTDRFLTMEFIDGESLGARMGREGPMGPDAAVAVIRAVAQALQAIHGAGVVHRDLKP
ncbi:MAG: protein kinase, partial [Myxococcales bacterium]|nr:protein kinase [Myxococcales bacterium]